MEDVRVLAELQDIVKQNKAQDYPRIIEQAASYPYLYHLSEVRCSLTDWLPLKEGMRVLERNAEGGALTGNLLKKAGQVTCVTADRVHARLIEARWASEDSSGLRVLTEEEWQEGTAAREAQFDTILLVGDFWRYRVELPVLYRLLRQDGRLIVADANRLGLKYFAGCQEEYRGGYFTGVQGDYPDGERSFSRSEYESYLRDAGFSQMTFYYPYPDHKFPSAIYSDEWLPGPGELSENRRNFDRDRLLLFDESRVYDALLAEGLFGRFSNSFLITAGKQECEQTERILYAKFSGERDRRYAIRTEIVEEASGKRYVRKLALHPEGDAHMEHICRMYGRLCESYTGSGIDFCTCERTGKGVRFAFVEGRTLEDLVKEMAQSGDRTGVERILQEYIRRVGEAGGSISFRETEEFTQVFGARMPGEGLDCAAVSDVDMIFSNILVTEGGARWTVIDYEWTFDFPIPRAFLLYRGLYFVYHQVLGGMGWGLPELLAMAGISAEQAGTFAAMEVGFQAYLGQGALPVRNMQRRMGTQVLPLPQLLAGAGEASRSVVPESEWLRVRKIVYHIDRTEYQDGSVICSGWAFATAKDGRSLPVQILVTDEQDRPIRAEVTRTERTDVARQLKVRAVTHPTWGFDCVWIAAPGQNWRIHFSLGDQEKVYVP